MQILQLLVMISVVSLSSSFLSPSLSLSSSELKVAQDINIRFAMEWIFDTDEVVTIRLPKFTRSAGSVETIAGTSLPYGSVVISPSLTFTAEWNEGTLWDAGGPFQTSSLKMKLIPGIVIDNPFLLVDITIFATNGISVYCGFPDSVDVSQGLMNTQVNSFFVSSNLHPNEDQGFTEYPLMGTGCADLNRCSNNGDCEYCLEKCSCYTGYGSSVDILTAGGGLDGTCSQRVCPSGKAIGDLAVATDTAHALAECSNYGTCNRKTGTCECFRPFGGSACDKLLCPNECSGHGSCLTIGEISLLDGGFPVTRNFLYGSTAGIRTTAWDHDIMTACLCDSSWPVGVKNGERQLSEFFGADCSLRRCPSGDDPSTPQIETNCQGKNQLGDVTEENRGEYGNLCHIDCSNRGVCDYSTGQCKCFAGSWGDSCENRIRTGSTANANPNIVGTS